MLLLNKKKYLTLFNEILIYLLRFDGKLGFPGGLIDDGEDTETGLNREVKVNKLILAYFRFIFRYNVWTHFCSV